MLNALQGLEAGRTRDTHTLQLGGRTADLRDCETTYIATDPKARADYRLVWRHLDPAAPGRPARSELIVLGQRVGATVYEEAGRRLERELPSPRVTGGRRCAGGPP